MIAPGSMVRIKGSRKVWKVVGMSLVTAELYRREQALMPLVEHVSIRQVWPVQMLDLVSAAA